MSSQKGREPHCGRRWCQILTPPGEQESGGGGGTRDCELTSKASLDPQNLLPELEFTLYILIISKNGSTGGGPNIQQ